MELLTHQGTFGVSPQYNNTLIAQKSPNKMQQNSPMKNSAINLKELLQQKCENANSQVLKKYPSIHHSIIEIINQFFREGRILSTNIDFLQQKIQKEIQFQLNKLRTSSKIGLMENIFYNNNHNNSNNKQQTQQHQSRMSNSPIRNVQYNQQQQDSQINQQGSNQKRLSIIVNNINGESQNSNNQSFQYPNESINHKNTPSIKPLNLGLLNNINNNNNQTIGGTPSHHQIQHQPNIYSSAQKNHQYNVFGKAARSSSYMGDVAKKNLALEQILLKNKGSIGDNHIREQQQQNHNLRMNKLSTQESELVGNSKSGSKANNNGTNYYSSNVRNMSNPRTRNVSHHQVDYTHNLLDIQQPTPNNRLYPLNNNDISLKSNNLGNIAQNNILNTTVGPFSDQLATNNKLVNGERNKTNKIKSGGKDEHYDDYMKEVKNIIELESEYDRQRARHLQDKEKIVYDTMRKQWDRQIDWKKMEAIKEKEIDKEYKKNIEVLLQEEIQQNQMRSYEKKKIAVDEKQHLLNQIQQKNENKERERSKEIEDERRKIIKNDNTIRNEKEQQRIIELNKIQQQNLMIVNHIQLSKDIRENQDKQNRQDELKRLKDQFIQQHTIDQRKDEEYINRISKISKRLF